jgi:hypothetical protein
LTASVTPSYPRVMEQSSRHRRSLGGEGDAMSAKPPTPFERFVEATKAILSVPKKDVKKDMRKFRQKRNRSRAQRRAG